MVVVVCVVFLVSGCGILSKLFGSWIDMDKEIMESGDFGILFMKSGSSILFIMICKCSKLGS